MNKYMAPVVLSGAVLAGSCGEQADSEPTMLDLSGVTVESSLSHDSESDAFLEGVNSYIEKYGCKVTGFAVQPVEDIDEGPFEGLAVGDFMIPVLASKEKIVVNMKWLDSVTDLQEFRFVGYHEAGHVCVDSDPESDNFNRFEEPYELDLSNFGSEKLTAIGVEGFVILTESGFHVSILDESFVNLMAAEEYEWSPPDDGYAINMSNLAQIFEETGLSLEQANEWRSSNDLYSLIGAIYGIDRDDVTPNHVVDVILFVARI